MPKALIVPHAGYAYSGPVAAHAYATLVPHGRRIRRAVIVGPAHRAYLDGLASADASAFATPLGDVRVDVEALSRAIGVVPDARVHAREHSLEVQLPFLQRIAPSAKIAPIAVGRAAPEFVARVLERLWGGDETVVIVSSDLSHHLPYRTGRATDEATAARISRLDATLGPAEACGCVGINGLLRVARARGMRADLVDLRNSGDTAGTRDSVVGYAAVALYEPAPLEGHRTSPADAASISAQY
jgi:hypothetical protein